MSRSVGEVELLHGILPEWAAYLLAALTQLADQWFLFVLLVSLLYFQVDRRERVAVVGGLWLAGVGLTHLTKYAIAAPRPETPLLNPADVAAGIRPLYEATALAGGYGLPSGHATSAAIVYLGLAWALSAGTRRRRFAAATILVATVSFTRLGLGVHYLADVIAGVFLGISIWVVWAVLSRPFHVDGPTRAFGLASVANAGFVISTLGDYRALIALGLSVGALVWWQRIEP